MRYRFLAIATTVFLAVTNVNAAEDGAHQGGEDKAADFHHQSNQIMEKMHKEMQAHQSTGDADIDFAKMMAIHHRGAIEMGQLYLKYQNNRNLKTMTEKGIAQQQREVKDLEAEAARERAPR